MGVQHAHDALDPTTTTLWFAGKQLLAHNRLADHVGRNEKSRVVIKLQPAGQGAPAREPVRISNPALTPFRPFFWLTAWERTLADIAPKPTNVTGAAKICGSH